MVYALLTRWYAPVRVSILTMSPSLTKRGLGSRIRSRFFAGLDVSDAYRRGAGFGSVIFFSTKNGSVISIGLSR